MTRSRYGMIAGLAGAAFATWWGWRKRTATSGASGVTPAGERGEVIFRNSPEV